MLSKSFTRILLLRSKTRLNLMKNMCSGSSYQTTNNKPDKQKTEVNSSIEEKSSDLDGPLFGKDVDFKIEENVRWKEVHYNPPELSKFKELLTRDPSNINRWVKVCEKRPDLLNASVDFLLEFKDYIILVIVTSPKNFFKILELLPPKFLTPDHQQNLLESFMLWNGFCRKYKIDTINIFQELPIVLMTDPNQFEERFNDLRDYFANTSEVKTLIEHMPFVLVESWPKLKLKLEFVIYKMKVSPKTLSRTKSLEYELNHIKDRYEFLLRTGLYRHPDMKTKSLKAEAYPLVNDVIETDLEFYINEVVGHGLKVEEFELFVKLRNEEFETEEESMLHLELGYEDHEFADDLIQSRKDAKGYKPNFRNE